MGPAGLGVPPHGRRLSDNGSDHFLEAVGSWFCAGVVVARPAGLGEAGRTPSGPSRPLTWPKFCTGVAVPPKLNWLKCANCDTSGVSIFNTINVP